jgi:hypothetical protein
MPQHPYAQRLLDEIECGRLAWTGLSSESYWRQRGVAPSDHNFSPDWNGRWVRWGADLDELIEPDRDGRLEQGEAQAREQTNRVLARRA